MQKIIHYLNIRSPKEQVYEAIATVDGLSNWWSTKVKGSEKEGGIVDFTFVDNFNPNMKITSLKKNSEVRWICISGHDLWEDNKFAFELSEDSEGTKLKFTQEYAKPIRDEDYGIYNFNWAHYLRSLQEYCTTGKGKPYSPGVN